MKSDRRAFLKSMAATAVVPTIAARGVVAEPTADALAANRKDAQISLRPKHVVLMICDDLGYGDLGCYGSGIKTPNLDKLAAQGARFNRFNAAHPICSASRAALLTGRYAQRSRTVGAFFPHSKYGMALEETTLANLFQDQGYRTKAIGKWHLGDAPEYLPTKRGFDSFYGVPYSVDMEPLPLIRDSTVLEAETDRLLLTPRYTEEAVRFLNEESDKPFFLYMAFSYPHDPARASARFHGKSGLGDYGDAVQEIDWSVGEVVQELEKKGILKDTLLLFTSDHGPWYQGRPGDLRGRKSSTFEGGFRVPFIAHWPSRIQAGAVSDTWLSNLDVLPTLTALCGLKDSPNPLDGIDISQSLVSGHESGTRKSVLYFDPSTTAGVEFHPINIANIADLPYEVLAGADLHCARKGDWKLRFAQVGGEIYISDYTTGRKSFWLSRPELYHLALDPNEGYDVAKEHPELVREILADVEEQVQGMPDVVKKAYAALQHNVAAPSTPPGAAPRPAASASTHPSWAWEPEDRR